MAVSDRFLWLIIASFGINIAQVNKGPFIKCLSYFVLCSFIVYTPYYSVSAIYFSAVSGALGEMFYVTLLPTVSVLWCLYFIHRKAISSNVLQLGRFQTRYRVRRQRSGCIKVVPILLIATKIGLYAAILLEKNSELFDVAETIMGFGRKIDSVTWKALLTVYGYCSFSLYLGAGFLLSFSASVLWYRWSEVLSAYNKNVQRISRKRQASAEFKYSDFFAIGDILQELNQTLGGISFCTITLIIQTLFIAVYEILRSLNVPGIGFWFWIENLQTITHSMFFLSVYAVCCSKISGALEDVKRSALKVTRSDGGVCFMSSRELQWLKEIEKEQALYVSAGGMFHVSKSSILSVASVILTYGLLIINYVLSNDMS